MTVSRANLPADARLFAWVGQNPKKNHRIALTADETKVTLPGDGEADAAQDSTAPIRQ
jgi:hypothetical protein